MHLSYFGEPCDDNSGRGCLPRRIVVLRALELGDMLCAVPFFRALGGASPAAWIVLVGRPWARDFVARYPMDLDEIRELPGYPDFPEQTPAVDLAGQMPLGPLAALLADARLLACNDAGVSHLADALSVPSVVISTGDNPTREAPADRNRHRVLCREPGVRLGEGIAEVWSLLEEGPAASQEPRFPHGDGDKSQNLAHPGD